MKTKEELNALKEEMETLSKKLAELSGDELKQIGGGFAIIPMICDACGSTAIWTDCDYNKKYPCPFCDAIEFHAK